ncbi:MAG TPA: acyl-CoA carboxylase subunit epsilon [Actinocrinis sp.]|nr:acyl-CoA carboxylase subunit epsilon [Actinocrinis sp.]
MTQNPDNVAGADVRILRGNPTDEELAALLAVIAVLCAGGPRTEPARHDQHGLRRRDGRHRHRPGSAVSWRRHQ